MDGQGESIIPHEVCDSDITSSQYCTEKYSAKISFVYTDIDAQIDCMRYQ